MEKKSRRGHSSERSELQRYSANDEQSNGKIEAIRNLNCHNSASLSHFPLSFFLAPQ